MSAELDRSKLLVSARFRPMTLADVPGVIAVERASYPFPWSDGVFRDCIRVGYLCRVVECLGEIGGYGIMSYGVARRRNEIGVRIALGAARSRVIRMVLGEVGRMVAVGVVLGVLLALGTMRVIASFLFGMTPTDTRTLVASGGLLLLVAVLAAARPAWRAAGLDPVAALRED